MIEILGTISLFKELATEEQLKLLRLVKEVWLQPGEMLFKQGDSANFFYLVLEGSIRLSQKIDNRELFIATYGADTFFGEVPLLAGTLHLASAQAVNEAHVYSLHKDDFWQMLITYPSVRSMILGLMASRLQEILTLSQHSEKLIALGTLAAGLAHELNNPASAALRAAEQLRDTMQNRHNLALKHIEQHLTPVQLEHLLKIKRNSIERATTSCFFEPLALIDLEDQFMNWLDEHEIIDGWKLAPTLVAGGLTIKDLDDLSQQIDITTLTDVLIWLEATLAEASLLNVLKFSTTRISELVKAVKAYSYMDQALQKHKNVDVHEGLENTLTILSHKIRKHGIAIARDYAENMPMIQADGSALNQVWTNLIDNAIDASTEQGTIWVRTSVDKDYIVVEIADNGVGIPPEIQPRIFEPFFTTKEIGQGTGIGLNLAYRIITGEHNGTIRCFSKPGDTSFVIRLPIKPQPSS